jgi:hypothetical protein
MVDFSEAIYVTRDWSVRRTQSAGISIHSTRQQETVVLNGSDRTDFERKYRDYCRFIITASEFEEWLTWRILRDIQQRQKVLTDENL